MRYESSWLLRRMRRCVTVAARLVRVTAFGGFVTACVACLAARSVYGSVTASMSEVSSQMLHATGGDAASYRASLNGERIDVESTLTDASVRDVLDAAQAECTRSVGPRPAWPDVWRALVPGLTRKESTGSGSVACIVRDGDGDPAALVRDVQALFSTHDLGKLGTLLYVTAERGPGAKKTHVLRTFTERSFKLDALFPREGDAAGSDLEGISRPSPDARRVLTATVDGWPLGVRIYDASGDPEEILARYAAELPRSGWTPVDVPPSHGSAGVRGVRVFYQRGTSLFVTASVERARTVVAFANVPPG
jgi:hypothetical protein